MKEFKPKVTDHTCSLLVVEEVDDDDDAGHGNGDDDESTFHALVRGSFSLFFLLFSFPSIRSSFFSLLQFVSCV